MTMNIIIDPEFKALTPPLSTEERRQLEANLLAEGCRNPLVVWGDQGILLDGHNRLEICRKHNIHYETTELFLPDRDAARSWILNNQLGRRNLSPNQKSFLRGLQYSSEKQAHGTNRYTRKSPHNVGSKTAERLAEEHKVSHTTIERDAQFADAVDTIAEACGDEAKDAILNPNTRITRKDVIGLVTKPPAFQRTIIAKIISGEAKDIRAAEQQFKRERTESQVEACQDRIVEGWYQGDWRDHIGKLADGTVSLLLTDPPYGEAYQSNRRKVLHDPFETDAALEQAAMELEALLMAMNSKLTTDAHLLIFCTWKSELSTRIAIENAGYVIRGVLVWVKNHHSSGSLTGAFTPQYEHVIHAVKGNPILTKRIDDVLEAAKVPTDRHPTEKPVDLLRRLIEATTVEGALVADPFGGVASTCVAAYEAGRRYWGCEIDPGYHSEGVDRLSDAP